MNVEIAGGGIVGLTVGLALARAGLTPTLHDPSALGDNASGVAAGMLAAEAEAEEPGVSSEEVTLLRAARAAWNALTFEGLTLVADSPVADAVLDPMATLTHLRDAFDKSGGRWSQARITIPRAAPLIIAAGFEARSLAALAPEVAVLAPIKGHILKYEGGPRKGPVLRWPDADPGLYIVPQPDGCLVGATMEHGRQDRAVDPAIAADLHARAVAHLPPLASVPYVARTGIRAATTDRLPLVGPSLTPGVWLATGMRRNGWLLAPLVAQIIAAYLTGDDPGPWAQLLDPRRFSKDAP